MPSFFREFQKAFADLFQEVIQPELNYKNEDEPEISDRIEMTQREVEDLIESFNWELKIFGNNIFVEDDKRYDEIAEGKR